MRAIEDPALVAELAERGTVLEVCPTEQRRLGVFASYEDHPLGALREAGVRVCLGSDDPPYFGSSVSAASTPWRASASAWMRVNCEMTRTALEGAFADDATRGVLFSPS